MRTQLEVAQRLGDTARLAGGRRRPADRHGPAVATGRRPAAAGSLGRDSRAGTGGAGRPGFAGVRGGRALSGPLWTLSRVDCGCWVSRTRCGGSWRNLLDNAVRHARSTVSVTVRPGGAYQVIVVTDDGPGIPAEDRERVFDRFTRLDDARARDAGGAGLGLAIVRELVRRHGGTVTLADVLPSGLTVEVRLPAAPDRRHDRHRVAPRDRLGRGLGSVVVKVARSDRRPRRATPTAITLCPAPQ